MSGDDFVGDDNGVAAPHQREHLAAGPLDQLRSHKNVVAAIAEIDVQPLDRFHLSSLYPSGGNIARGHAANAAIARVTVASGDPSPLSTTTSASA